MEACAVESDDGSLWDAGVPAGFCLYGSLRSVT